MLFLYLPNLFSFFKLYSFFDKVSWAALHLGINFADIDTCDTHTRGDYATDKPHGNEQGGPALAFEGVVPRRAARRRRVQDRRRGGGVRIDARDRTHASSGPASHDFGQCGADFSG